MYTFFCIHSSSELSRFIQSGKLLNYYPCVRTNPKGCKIYLCSDNPIAQSAKTKPMRKALTLSAYVIVQIEIDELHLPAYLLAVH